MIRVALVEDEESSQRTLTEYLERFSQEINEKIHVSIFPDGAEIVEDYRGNYDIILMDILMRYMDGMEAASEIRKVDKEVVILFITSTPQYVMKGYTVDALDYVLKPVSYFAFSQRMQRALERMKHRTRKFISVPFQGGMRKLDISQIRYIEVVNHSLIYHLDGETLEAKGVLSELEDALTEYHFFRCNKCYLVNLEHVNGVNENCADVDGDQIQVSRPKKKAFLDALNNYINEVGNDTRRFVAYAGSALCAGVLAEQYLLHSMYGSPFSKGRKFGISAGFLALIAGFMTLTDGVSAIGFFPCMGVTVALIFFYIRIATHMPWANAGYYCARAFILGEFSASLAWYLFYFFVTVPGLPLTVWTTILVFAAVHAIILYTMFLLERKYRDGSKLIKITARELFTAAVLAIAVFSVSNISFAFTGTPFSSQFTAEIYIIRTTVDLGGVAMLFAYHVVILEISTEREMEHLQALLHMQYESYRISEESIALVNQKYHDLKHHIQLLRAASAAERTEYLDQMEQQIRTYEAQNKTGNRVLDTILTAKTIQCQSEGISLTCVADGQALDFMNPMDISALFGNALDNAIESVKKLPNPEQRLIHVSAMRQKDFLRIRVENCYSGELRFVDGMPTTTKRDARYHGYGLKSIQSIANSYGGSATIDTKDGWFELRLLLPVPKEKKGETAEKRDERTKA